MNKDTLCDQTAAADIEAGLREAERGEFATDAQVAATVAKYTKRQRIPLHDRASMDCAGSHALRSRADSGGDA